MKEQFADLMRRATRTAIGTSRSLGAQTWYSLNAPSSIEQVNRSDPRSIFLWLRARYAAGGRGPSEHSYGTWRPEYAWGIISAAMTTVALGLDGFTAVEFGVAGGNGLLAMEAVAGDVERMMGIRIAVAGFDTGKGMPRPTDLRDAPFAVRQGQFDMDERALRSKLHRAELKLGPISRTAEDFVQRSRLPIGFCGFDVDYYSSTMDAFQVLEAESDRLLPRVFCYFQGVMWHPWTDNNGARAAMHDYNSAHEQRKISKLHGLKYTLPRSEFRKPWPEMMYVAEMFDHALYDADQHVEPFDTRLAID